jgi:hypothetical protein
MDYRIGKPGSSDFSCGMNLIGQTPLRVSLHSNSARFAVPAPHPRCCALRKRIAQLLPG